jgi:hypothetical protein
MDPDQPGHPRSLIRIHAVRIQTLLQVEKLIANSMDPDQIARRILHWLPVQTGISSMRETVYSCNKTLPSFRLTITRELDIPVSYNSRSLILFLAYYILIIFPKEIM